MEGPEDAGLPEDEVGFHSAEYARLRGVLEEAASASELPTAPSGKPALNDLILRLRLG